MNEGIYDFQNFLAYGTRLKTQAEGRGDWVSAEAFGDVLECVEQMVEAMRECEPPNDREIENDN